MTEHKEQTQGPWTEEEAAAFAQTLITFGEGLPPRQRDAFARILATAGATARADDVQGYHPLLWGVLGGSIVTAANKMGAFDKAPGINEAQELLKQRGRPS